MNDNEIIKAFNSAFIPDGANVYLWVPKEEDVVVIPIKNLAEFINRQQAEIERLKERIIEVQRCDKELIETLHKVHEEKIETAKAEAIKEFAERLKEKAGYVVAERDGQELYETKSYSINAIKLDNLVKEMVGDTE